jgi:hypothetical protein
MMQQDYDYDRLLKEWRGNSADRSNTEDFERWFALTHPTEMYISRAQALVAMAMKGLNGAHVQAFRESWGRDHDPADIAKFDQRYGQGLGEWYLGLPFNPSE